METSTTTYSFLHDGGEMGDLTRTFDWSTTPLGTPDQWPLSLRTTVGLLLHSAFPMLLFWGKDSMITFYNDAFLPSLGSNGKHPAVGKPAREVWSDIWDYIGPLLLQVMSTGKPVYFEDKLVPFYRNGRTEDIYWTFSYSPAFGEEGLINGVFVTCTETTRKVESVRNLVELNTQLQFAIEAAQLGTWDLNPVTGKFTANARLKEWFGLHPEEETDLSRGLEALDVNDRDRIATAIKTAMLYESGGTYEADYTLVNPVNGLRRKVRAKGLASFDENRVAIRLNGTLLDITEQSAYTASLAESEARFRSLIEEAPVATCLFVGREMKIEVANNTMIGYWGKDESVIGKPLAEAVPELKGQVFLDILANVFDTGETHASRGAPALLQVGGKLSTYYFDYTYKPLFDAAGKVYGIMDMAVDVTDQVLARQQIEEVVAQRTQELAEANRLLENNNRELEQFAYVASHDLQEPLRKVSTYTDMLKKHLGKVDDRSSNYLNKITTSTLRMMQLIRDVLNFSKLSNKRQLFEQVDLNALIEQLKSDFELVIEQKGAIISSGALPTVTANPLQMQQLFGNLLSNALKFTREGHVPVISIFAQELTDQERKNHHSLLPDMDYCLITIADNGIGFEKEHAERIFSIFQRLHAKANFAGTGIGLALCKKIAQNHHGEIWATSKTDMGASFHIILPCPKPERVKERIAILMES